MLPHVIDEGQPLAVVVAVGSDDQGASYQSVTGGVGASIGKQVARCVGELALSALATTSATSGVMVQALSLGSISTLQQRLRRRSFGHFPEPGSGSDDHVAIVNGSGIPKPLACSFSQLKRRSVQRRRRSKEMGIAFRN